LAGGLAEGALDEQASSGESSTSRMGKALAFMPARLRLRQLDPEPAAPAPGSTRRRLPSEARRPLLHDGEADAGARILLHAMQPLEGAELRS